jgi:hypothetical protein
MGFIFRYAMEHPNQPKKNPHAVALGKLGGSKATAAQRRASKENGKRGGRPKKVRFPDPNPK